MGEGGGLVSTTVYVYCMQLLKSKEKEIEQLEEKLSSFGERSGMTGGSYNCGMIYSLDPLSPSLPQQMMME